MVFGTQTLRGAPLALFCASFGCALDVANQPKDTASTIPTLPPTTAIEPQASLSGRYEGAARADAGGWAGSESFVVEDDTGLVLCRWTWQTQDTSSEAMPPDCNTSTGDVCVFWHTIQLQGGRDETETEEGESACAGFRDAARLLPDGGLITYGFASDIGSASAKTGVSGRLLRYAWPQPPLPGAWLEFSEPARWSGGELSYVIPVDLDLL